MLTPKGQIQRTGTVSFSDASLSVWEESIPSPHDAGGHKARDAWELAFRRQVFKRIIQTLNRLGWTVAQPPINPHDVKHYGGTVARWASERRRDCSKGDLKGELEVSGRSITFKMWQSVNTPTRPDNGGRYESNLEACMPYVLRLEMERTRRRIRDYLCTVFDCYKFDSEHRTIYRKPLQFTALELIQKSYDESCHFKGDMPRYLKQNGWTELPGYSCKSRDGKRIEHLSKVWFIGRGGRIGEGTAYYCSNGMWRILTGRYDTSYASAGEVFVDRPPNPRVKLNERLRRKRLEGELARAVKDMDFDRAKVLKGILWPEPEPLFHILKKGAYFLPNYNGYTDNPVDAGKYTEAELKPYAGDIKAGQLRAVPVAA